MAKIENIKIAGNIEAVCSKDKYLTFTVRIGGREFTSEIIPKIGKKFVNSQEEREEIRNNFLDTIFTYFFSENNLLVKNK